MGRRARSLPSLAHDRTGHASFSVVAILLLVGLSYSALLMGPLGPLRGDRGCELGLEEVSERLRGCLSGALDNALEEAVPRAAMDGGLDLASVLDADLSRALSRLLPREVGGWSVALVEARAGLSVEGSREGEGPGAPPCAWAPEARACVDLRRPGSPPVRLDLVSRGPPASPNRAVARAATLAGSLVDDEGPVAMEARALLWRTAQGAALGSGRRPEGLLEEGDVGEAISAALRGLSGSPVPCLRGPPPLDLEALVRQGVQGALEANCGWVDEYLLGGGGLASLLASWESLEWLAPLLEALGDVEDLEGRLVDLASELVADMALACLEEVLGGLPAIGTDGGLEDMVSSGVRLLDELSCLLEAHLGTQGPDMGAGKELADEAIGAVLEALGLGDVVEPPRELCQRAALLLDAASSAAARLGLHCARDALLAVAALGEEVPGSVDRGDGTLDRWGPRVSLVELDVTTRWSGTVACEPGRALASLVGLTMEGGGEDVVPLGALPYVARCAARARGTALVEVELPSTRVGAKGCPGRLSTAWEVPVDLELVVPVATGWALEGVAYEPSRTLAGDAVAALEALYARVGEGVGWVAQRLGDAARWVGSQVRGLLEDMAESVLETSAYTLSQALWRIGEAAVKREMGKALNGTWDLLMDLFGEDLGERLRFDLQLCGWDVVVSLDVALQQLVVELVRGRVTVQLSLRRLCDPHPPFRPKPVDGFYWGVFGRAVLDLGEHGAVLLVDPLTLERPAMVTLVARWGGDGGGDGGGELVVEAVEARKQRGRVGIRLSEVAGGPQLLSLAGTCGVDAGLVVHGDLAEEGAVGEMLARATKQAWLASVRGWRVGDLVGETGRGPDAAMFLQVLFRELYAALVEEGGDLVDEVEAFCEVDPPSPAWPRVRLSLVIARPLEVLLPLQAWVARELAGLVGWASTGSPGRAASALRASLAEHVMVRAELLWTVGPPPWLVERLDGALPDEVGLVLRGEVNMAALAALGGLDAGVWRATTEVLLRGVPGGALALLPGLGSTKWRWAEVTLVRLTIEEAWAPRVLISQVLYDAEGRDADLELVELVNAGGRMVDAGDLVLHDDHGSFRLRGHLPLLPGDRLLVARNGSAVWDAFRVLPDVDRMGLRLSNDGDVLRLVWGEDTVLDMVAWEGALQGWEGLEAGEGEALVRRDGDARSGDVAAWEVGPPVLR